MKSIVQTCLLMFAFVCGAVISGCDVEEVTELFNGKQGQQVEIAKTTPTGGHHSDVITIASFNIQVFGQSKLKKPEAMDVLAKVVRKFDIVAIQEIRSKEDDVMPRFVELINSNGRQYDFVIGERLGRTSSKEQYAYVFDATRVEYVPNSAYTVPDPTDQLHREPLAASFRVRVNSSSEAFSFTLINIHTDPDETKTELDALDDAYMFVQHNNPAEDDVILLGDLNVDAEHLGQLGALPGITWTVPATVTTNTRGSESYDNIIFSRTATSEFTGRSGVLDLLAEFNLTKDEALKVSDHMPVWAEFSAREGGLTPHVATRPKAVE